MIRFMLGWEDAHHGVKMRIPLEPLTLASREARLAFEITFSPAAQKHVKALRKRDQRIVLQAIEVQLRHQPDQPTKQRKLLHENPLAPWELRIGDFRVFYDVDRDATLVVVLAVGQKTHNVLQIGGEEVQL